MFSKFYQRTDGPCIDVGAFAEALKYSSGCRHVVIGKPRGDYFQTALDSMGLAKDEVNRDCLVFLFNHGFLPLQLLYNYEMI